MRTSDGWTVLVLAAGRGRRMGGPKALMRLGPSAWWEVQEAHLDASGLRRVWVVSHDVAGAMAGSGAELVLSGSAEPMFPSVCAGLAAADGAAGLFILPVDVPAPEASIFNLLAAAAGDQVAVPVYRATRGHPIALSRPWIERVLRPACVSAVGAGRLDLLTAADVREAPVGDDSVLVNLNTSDDVERWLAARTARFPGNRSTTACERESRAVRTAS